MHRLVREPKRAHPCLGEASAALPGVADGKPHAAVSQPPAVTLVVFLETPGGVKMADQRQLGSLTSACLYRLVEGERPRYVGDGACRKKKFNLVCHIFLAAVETNTGQVFFPLRNFPITSHQQMLLSSVSLPSVPLSHWEYRVDIWWNTTKLLWNKQHLLFTHHWTVLLRWKYQENHGIMLTAAPALGNTDAIVQILSCEYLTHLIFIWMSLMTLRASHYQIILVGFH